MSLIENKTFELWKDFRGEVVSINHRLGSDFFSVQNFPTDYFQKYNPSSQFEKWAAVEVTGHENIPKNLEAFVLPAGLYAVFHYVGSSANAAEVFQFIYGEWLPDSDFQLDNRPHFEVLGEKYKNNDPISEEDIWIPIKPK